MLVVLGFRPRHGTSGLFLQPYSQLFLHEIQQHMPNGIPTLHTLGTKITPGLLLGPDRHAVGEFDLHARQTSTTCMTCQHLLKLTQYNVKGERR